MGDKFKLYYFTLLIYNDQYNNEFCYVHLVKINNATAR